MDEFNHWEAGFEAFESGKKETDCPYAENSILAKEWLNGFRLAGSVRNPGWSYASVKDDLKN